MLGCGISLDRIQWTR